MTGVFPDQAYNTPMDTPGWTAQNSATGDDQNLTAHAGVTAAGLATLVTAQTALGSAQTAASVTGVTGTDAANLAKLTDLKAVAAAVDALNAALVTAGIEV